MRREFPDLEQRIGLVIDELEGPPSPEILQAVPYWKELAEAAMRKYSSLDIFFRERERKSEIGSHFPSSEQIDAATQILEKKRVVIRDATGVGKTASALLAAYGIEQLHNHPNLVTVITCPTFVASGWKSKINSYTTDDRKTIIFNSSNREEALDILKRGLSDNSLRTAIITYDSMFRQMQVAQDEEEEYEIGREFEETILADEVIKAIDQNPMYLIGDEAHYSKNDKAWRSQAFRKLAIRSDYFAAMTASIFHNGLQDIYNLISLIDNDMFESADQARQAYYENPGLIRMFLHRRGKNPVVSLRDIEGMPEAPYFNYRWHELSDAERTITDAIVNHKDFSYWDKSILLRLATTDPSLINPENYRGTDRLRSMLDKMFMLTPEAADALKFATSTRLAILEEDIARMAYAGEKGVIFSSFKQGILESLQRKYSHLNARRIDGSVSSDLQGGIISPRDIERYTFQTDPDCKLLIAQEQSVREGQNFHAANHAFFLHWHQAPGVNTQLIGREDRRLQKKQVQVYVYGARATQDIGIYESAKIKEEAGIRVEQGLQLTANQRTLLENGVSVVNRPEVRVYLTQAPVLVKQMSGQMIGRGTKENLSFLATGENARLYAQAYNFNWIYTYSAHTARLIKHLVSELESGGQNFESIIDIGCGPATVARILDRKTTSLDINPHQLNLGKIECEKKGIALETIVASSDSIPIVGVKYKLSVLSLCLHYGNPERGDRKRTLLEAHRLTEPGGYLIVTLPESIIKEEGQELLRQGLQEIGWQALDDKTGVVRGIDSINGRYKSYVTVCRRLDMENPKSLYENDRYNEFFTLNPGFGYADFSEIKPNGLEHQAGTKVNLEICNHFEFIGSGKLIGKKEFPIEVVKKVDPNYQVGRLASPLAAKPDEFLAWLNGMQDEEK